MIEAINICNKWAFCETELKVEYFLFKIIIFEILLWILQWQIIMKLFLLHI